MTTVRAEIVELLVSPVHRYEGRPSHWLDAPPPVELVRAVTVRAGLGIVGDRYFARRAHADAAITLMAAESLAAFPGAGLTQTRRNVLLRGVAVDDLVGATITLDCGDGPVRLLARRRANPCAWMDAALGPGGFRGLRGRGGLRCEPLSDGVLRVGPVTVTIGAPS